MLAHHMVADSYTRPIEITVIAKLRPCFGQLRQKASLRGGVRQSSAHQVLHNRESSALQYAMRDRLTALGWSEVEVIDDDLGRSAAGGVQRAGFERMVAEVSAAISGFRHSRKPRMRYQRAHRRLVPDISQKMLTQHLRELQNDGLIERRDFGEQPPHVEYGLTNSGRGLMPVLMSAREFSRLHPWEANNIPS